MKTRLLSLLAGIAVLAACTTLTAIQSALNSPVAQKVEAAVVPLISSYVTAGKYNQASAINLGLQSISALAPTVAQQAGMPALQGLIASTVTTYTADKSAMGTKLASDLAASIIKSLGSNPTAAQVSAAVITAGTTAANTAGTTAANTAG